MFAHIDFFLGWVTQIYNNNKRITLFQILLLHFFSIVFPGGKAERDNVSFICSSKSLSSRCWTDIRSSCSDLRCTSTWRTTLTTPAGGELVHMLLCWPHWGYRTEEGQFFLGMKNWLVKQLNIIQLLVVTIYIILLFINVIQTFV